MPSSTLHKNRWFLNRESRSSLQGFWTGTGYNVARRIGGREENMAQAVISRKDLETWARGMRQKIESHALRVILSVRTLLRMAQAVEAYGQSVETAIEKEFLARLPTEVRDLLS